MWRLISNELQLMLVEGLCSRQVVKVLQTDAEADWQLVASGAC